MNAYKRKMIKAILRKLLRASYTHSKPMRITIEYNLLKIILNCKF